MTHKSASIMEESVKAHAAADDEEIRFLRALGPQERSNLIVLACAAAADIRQSRLMAGLPDVVPDPWPQSTWEFLKEHAAHVRT